MKTSTQFQIACFAVAAIAVCLAVHLQWQADDLFHRLNQAEQKHAEHEVRTYARIGNLAQANHANHDQVVAVHRSNERLRERIDAIEQFCGINPDQASSPRQKAMPPEFIPPDGMTTTITRTGSDMVIAVPATPKSQSTVVWPTLDPAQNARWKWDVKDKLWEYKGPVRISYHKPATPACQPSRQRPDIHPPRQINLKR